MNNLLINNNWLVRFRLTDDIGALPKALMVAMETRNNTNYRLSGRTRKDKKHCIFQYTLEGEGRFEDSTGKWSVPEEYAFLCRSDDKSVIYYYPEKAIKPWRFLYFCFDGELSLKMIRILNQLNKKPVWHLPFKSSAIQRLLQYSPKKQKLLKSSATLSQQWFKTITLQAISSADSVELVMHLLISLLEAIKKEKAVTASSLMVKRIKMIVDENLNASLNVTSLAEMLNVSREHIARVFHSETGWKLHKYILHQKMLLASDMIKMGNFSIKEIAASFGFVSPAHFSRAFKQKFNVSPSSFRITGRTGL
jgi:AraC-like DNA-binding protein